MNRASEFPSHSPSVEPSLLESNDDDFIRLLKVKASLEHRTEPLCRPIASVHFGAHDLFLAERQARRRGVEFELYLRELFHVAVHAQETLLQPETDLL